jgi:tRNA (guanine-N1)-methyltransferase
LAKESHLIFLCGHYEGVDHRVVEALVDEEISIGDYVLTNGTIAAAVVVDAVVRLLPGVLGDDQSAEVESFSGDGKRLEAPHYTRPAEYAGMAVPEVLLSGNQNALASKHPGSQSSSTRLQVPSSWRCMGRSCQSCPGRGVPFSTAAMISACRVAEAAALVRSHALPPAGVASVTVI